MDNNQVEALKSLAVACQNIKTKGLLLSSESIKEILILVTKNEILKKCLDEAHKYVDYDQISEDAFEQTNSGRFNFIMPSSARKRIVLITGILFEIDRGSINITRMLHDFFTGVNIADSFTMFTNAVLDNYIAAFKDVITGAELSEDEKGRYIVVEEEKYNLIENVIKEQIQPFIAAILDEISSIKNINEKQRIETIYVINGFAYSLESFNSRILITVWIALKSMLVKFKKLTPFVKEIDNILEKYDITM